MTQSAIISPRPLSPARPPAPWWPSRILPWQFHSPHEEVMQYAAEKSWAWPMERVCFLCDVHADAEAFLRSLDASGGIVRTGPGASDYRLSPKGKRTTFIIGGDCLDKGPSNLELLRAMAQFRSTGARLILLAGNHDLRTLLGLSSLGHDEILWQHLFVRMGKKTMRLLEEIYEEEVAPRIDSTDLLPAAEVRRRLFPRDDWYERFPLLAADRINPKKLKKETKRIREKIADIEAYCAKRNWTLGHLYAAVEATRAAFLDERGEFSWFFDEMALCYRAGSFLFLHAGVDDVAAELIGRRGTEGLNEEFQRLLKTDLFELYHGSVGNCFRTKYRDIDLPLTEAGRARLHNAGIYSIVHGHKNTTEGQRIVLRESILNFECDASVDENTRRAEGLASPGGAVTIFEPDGRVLGISADADHVKLFAPQHLAG